VGDSVKEGDIILGFEAMKMENQIAAPVSGVITAINVTPGKAINTGDSMLVIG
jgi:biotin carboxyl carrier protein